MGSAGGRSCFMCKTMIIFSCLLNQGYVCDLSERPRDPGGNSRAKGGRGFRPIVSSLYHRLFQPFSPVGTPGKVLDDCARLGKGS